MPLEGDKSSFGSKCRLKSSLQIQEVLRHKRYVYVFPIKCYYKFTAESNALGNCKLAIIVRKRCFKRAVDRNRLKRLMREAYRLHKFHIPESYASCETLKMCWLYISDNIESFSTVEKAAVTILTKLDKEMRKNSL